MRIQIFDSFTQSLGLKEIIHIKTFLLTKAHSIFRLHCHCLIAFLMQLSAKEASRCSDRSSRTSSSNLPFPLPSPYLKSSSCLQMTFAHLQWVVFTSQEPRCLSTAEPLSKCLLRWSRTPLPVAPTCWSWPHSRKLSSCFPTCRSPSVWRCGPSISLAATPVLRISAPSPACPFFSNSETQMASWRRWSPSGVPRPAVSAAHGNFLEMQIL